MGRGARKASGAGPGAPGNGRSRLPAARTALAVLGILALCALAYAALPLTGNDKTAALCAGELKRLYPAEAILARVEMPVISPAGGQVSMLVQEGTRVRPGDSIAEVKTMAGDAGSPGISALIRAPRSGVVIRQTDGLEEVLNPAQMDILEIAGRQAKVAEAPFRGDWKSDRCDKGQPVMKVVDNLSPLSICLQVPDGFPADRVKKGGSLSMVWEGKDLTGRIAEAAEYNGRLRVVVRVQNYPVELMKKRKVSLSLAAGAVTGYIVPTRSLVVRDGQQGLYILDKSQTRWIPVKVEGVVNDRAAVTGDRVVPGARYVENPRRFFNRV